MKINCDNCNIVFNKRPSAICKENYCSKECRHKAKIITQKCCVCGGEFTRYKSSASETPLCGKNCHAKWQSNHMTKMNIKLNPERMTLEMRLKLRESKLTNGEHKTKSYKKYLGRHQHRIIAENKMGRELKPGEVVHHIDEDIHNNSEENLQVLNSQSEHLRLHNLKRYAK